MSYWIFYSMMCVGYLGLALQSPSIKMKVIGILLTLVNSILFWK